MSRLLIYLLTIFLLFSALGNAQTFEFKKYTNQTYKFSFDIPIHWTIKYSKEQDGVICIPTTKAEKEIYEDCFEGIVFRMFSYNSGLDTTLFNEGLYTKIDSIYYTSDKFRDSVKCENIKGDTWTGIYHNNACGGRCKDIGTHLGQCEFIYFSNDKTTICITTNGREFDDKILKRLLNSFRFD